MKTKKRSKRPAQFQTGFNFSVSDGNYPLPPSVFDDELETLQRIFWNHPDTPAHEEFTPVRFPGVVVL